MICRVCNKETKGENICRPCACVIKNNKALNLRVRQEDWYRDWMEIKQRKFKTEQRIKKLKELGI